MTKQRLQQKQYQNLSPQQIQFLGLLQIPIVSLEKRIEEEIEENPALEEEEENDPHYSYNPAKTNFGALQIEDKSESLNNYLTNQLVGINLTDNLKFLVEYLINSLNSNGFLARDLYSIQSDLLINHNLKSSEKKLQSALKILQNLEPFGVGAANLQECLLIQLRHLHPEKHLAAKIISHYYSPFSNKNFEHLTKNLEVSEAELKEVYNLIGSLNPIPSDGFTLTSSATDYIYADFTILITNNTIELQLNKSNTKKLKVNKYYSDLLLETSNKETKDFLKKKIEKAIWFKEAIEKRNKTLRKVMEVIISLQESYFKTGNDLDLMPMKLSDVSSIVNMDISTISRVSNSKYIETHFGTFKVKELFSDAYKKENGEEVSTNVIKKHLKEIIFSESKKNPFTDEKLSDLLGRDEYHIARRTVAKYREQLGIETAKLRREL